MKEGFSAIAVLMGTIIGAGILALPFAISKSGFILGALILIVIAMLMTKIYFYLAEIGIKTSGRHQLTGYAQKYLGKKGKLAMLLAITFGIYTAMTAYIIGESESISYVLFNSSNHSFIIGILFWLIPPSIIFLKNKTFEKSERLGIISVFALIFLSIILFANKIETSNIYFINPSKFFFPLGVSIFAFLGFSAVPEVVRILKKNKKEINKTILTSMILVLSIYLIFVFVVLGTTGKSISQVSTISLGKIFVLLGIITMFNASVALTNAMRNVFLFDYKKSNLTSCVLASLPSLILFIILKIFHQAAFVKIIEISGIISGGLTALLIILMIRKVRRT